MADGQCRQVHVVRLDEHAGQEADAEGGDNRIHDLLTAVVAEDEEVAPAVDVGGQLAALCLIKGGAHVGNDHDVDVRRDIFPGEVDGQHVEALVDERVSEIDALGKAVVVAVAGLVDVAHPVAREESDLGRLDDKALECSGDFGLGGVLLVVVVETEEAALSILTFDDADEAVALGSQVDDLAYLFRSEEHVEVEVEDLAHLFRLLTVVQPHEAVVERLVVCLVPEIDVAHLDLGLEAQVLLKSLHVELELAGKPAAVVRLQEVDVGRDGQSAVELLHDVLAGAGERVRLGGGAVIVELQRGQRREIADEEGGSHHSRIGSPRTGTGHLAASGTELQDGEADEQHDDNEEVEHVLRTDESVDELVGASGDGEPVGDVADEGIVLPHLADVVEGGEHGERTHGGDHLIGGDARHEQSDGAVGTDEQVDAQDAREDQRQVGVLHRQSRKHGHDQQREDER